MAGGREMADRGGAGNENVEPAKALLDGSRELIDLGFDLGTAGLIAGAELR